MDPHQGFCLYVFSVLLVFLWGSSKGELVYLWLLCLFLGFFSSYWFALSSLNMAALPCFIVLCFFLFCCGRFEICSFLKRKWSGSGSGRKGRWKKQREGKLWLGCIVWEKLRLRKLNKISKRELHRLARNWVCTWWPIILSLNGISIYEPWHWRNLYDTGWKLDYMSRGGKNNS